MAWRAARASVTTGAAILMALAALRRRAIKVSI